MLSSDQIVTMSPESDVLDAAFGGSSPRLTSYTKQMLAKTCREASATEIQAIISSGEKAKRFSWLLMSPSNIARLRSKGAYSVSAFAEDDAAKAKDCVELRDWVAKTFECSPTVGTGDADPRDYFVTWRIFHERANQRLVYLPTTVIERSLRSSGISAARAHACLSDGPQGSGVATHVEFVKMQAAVRSFVRNAVSLETASDPSAALREAGLDAHQISVARGIIATPFSVLHGGAGTGKSTLIAAIVRYFVRQRTPVLCLAPTHRAKKNLAKRIPREAEVATVDSFIKSAANAQSSPKAPQSPKKLFLFVDEASMVDLEKMASLAWTRPAASNQKWQVCMTGDDGQLEPIARGEMFRTMIHNGGAHVFELQKCYRAENEDLLQAQRDIRVGRVPKDSQCVKIALLESDQKIERALAPYIETHKDGVQYIAWTNKMCALVNAHVQKQVHDPSKLAGAALGSAVAGDRVVYIGKNLVKKGLTNAMLGTVKVAKGKECSVVWDDTKDTSWCASSDVILAYCVTVHRAQGSQFEHVCVIASSVDAMMRALDRRWAYTAVSRAQRKCDVFSTREFEAFVQKPIRKREMIGVNFATTARNQGVDVKA